MNNFDNYVFLSICEVTLKPYKAKTNYTNYVSFCKGMLTAIKSDTITRNQQEIVIAISDELQLLYALSIPEVEDYIVRFFESDRCGDFERVVYSTNFLFPYTGD
jgi:hypothetical protein